MSSEPLSCAERAYNIFHPWSDRVRQEDRCCNWITFLVITLLSVGIVPIVYYIAYYTCCSSEARPTPDPKKVEVIDPPKFETTEEDQLYKTLQQEIALTQKIDRGPTNPGWLKFEKNKDQSFEEFASYWYSNQEERPLYIQLIGEFSSTDRKVIDFTIDYLKAFHRVDVHLVKTVIPMGELKDVLLEKSWNKELLETCFPRQKKWGNKTVSQYYANDALDALGILKQKYAPKNAHYIAFTSEFLYAAGLDNFVFGLGRYGGSGIWSNFLFGNPEKEFRTVTERMMKISAHEFGHMLHISHCEAHECNIGGYMSLPELDSRPFYYCSKDTAKLCLMKGISLKEYYTSLLAFFKTFNKKNSTDLFEKDAKHVEKKLRILKANPQTYAVEPDLQEEESI